MWKLLTLIVIGHCQEISSGPHSLLNGKSHFTETTLDRYLRDMVRLNNINKKLFNMPDEANDSPHWDAEPRKPYELPYLFEGDIILTEQQMADVIRNAEDQLPKDEGETGRETRALTSYLPGRWSMPIPYYINTGTGVDSAAVLAGVARWEQETCVTFSRQFSRPNGPALEFILGSGCYSYIGRIGNVQQVSIGYGCTSLGTVTHEIGHALGFYHEQSRWDRDSFVRILTQNIQSAFVSQFSKQSRSSMVDFGVGYDYGSVMHYDSTSFTSSGRDTIETLDPNYQSTIGQRLAPSFADVKIVNLAYCNSSCSNQLNCEHGGYTDPKNCAQCRCADGFGGDLCERAANSPAACGWGDLPSSGEFQTLRASGSVSCSFLITAPAGKKIVFKMNSMVFSRTSTCQANFVELKYKAEFQSQGARFCSAFPTVSISETNKMVVIYKGTSGTSFSMQYRYDPVDPVVSTSSSTTTTTARPQTTTTAPTTATTPTPTTTQRTTTTTTTTQRTTPAPWTTTRPTQRTRHTRPWQTTTNAPVTPGCTTWSPCTARCGGCGTSTRRCGGRLSTVYCNTRPCSGNYCCKPFFFVVQGYCLRPYTDGELSSTIHSDFNMDEEVEVVETVQDEVPLTNDEMESSGIEVTP